MTKNLLNTFDNNKYVKLALKNKNRYKRNKPFPHIYFDNFLPKNIAKVLSNEYPKIKNVDNNWKTHKNKNVIRYFLEDSSLYKKNLQIFSMLINSRKFLLFLETLTGIESIIPDPFFIGGGAMTTGKGGFLNVHADFNYHHKLQSWRRINVLFYLTPGWKKSWGGNLEFWTKNKKEKVKDIEPLFNRVVIFNTTSKSFHGQPNPINCPPNMSRNVFSSFYYSNVKDKESLSEPHFTRYSIKNNPYARKILKDYKKSTY
jgi:Rps23 Pro-64 3,4-dihydroxylase Tpa1-like proline 4-hydroxylase